MYKLFSNWFLFKNRQNLTTQNEDSECQSTQELALVNTSYSILKGLANYRHRIGRSFANNGIDQSLESANDWPIHWPILGLVQQKRSTLYQMQDFFPYYLQNGNFFTNFPLFDAQQDFLINRWILGSAKMDRHQPIFFWKDLHKPISQSPKINIGRFFNCLESVDP